MGKHFGFFGSIVTASIGKTLCGLILGLAVGIEPVGATTYFISPKGVDSNTGAATTSPWQTFTKALATMVCGDTLNLMDGVYGDGTNTGKISITSLACTRGAELTIRALNSRKARVHDNGTGQAIRIVGASSASPSSYIIIDGLVASSVNNAAGTCSTCGIPVYGTFANHITVKNSLVRNPNAYANTHGIFFVTVQDSLVEDTEIYNYHRHGIAFFTSQRDVARRVYCNARTGKIEGGFGTDQSPPGTASACTSFYPCTDCIAENVIAEGTNAPTYINESNATFNGNILMSGSKILGSIGYNTYANGIYLNGRTTTGSSYSPTNITIENVAFINHTSSQCIRNSDGVNIVLNHITCLGNGAKEGIVNDDQACCGAASNSFTLTNSLVKGVSTFGFRVTSVASWSGNELYSYNNGTAFSPSLPSSWMKTATTDPGLGNCKVWVPTEAAAKGAGTNGEDIGANILYRYKNGVLTNVPLWNPATGEFPHGAIVAGVNDVAGQSLFDVHKRLNVNTNGCTFPANYGSGVTDGDAPATPANLSVF